MDSGREAVIVGAARAPVGQYGPVTRCIGAGRGIATIVERAGWPAVPQRLCGESGAATATAPLPLLPYRCAPYLSSTGAAAGSRPAVAGVSSVEVSSRLRKARTRSISGALS